MRIAKYTYLKLPLPITLAQAHDYHGLRGSASPCSVNGDWLSQCEMAIFNPLQNRHPLPIAKKFVTGDYVGDPYSCAKFGAQPSTGGLLGEWVKYN